MTVSLFTNESSPSNRQRRPRTKTDKLSLTDPQKINRMHRKTADWVGYILKLERQRRSLTQTHIASELGFGMSYVSTIESGSAFANIDRTMMLIHFLGIDSCTCIGAIEGPDHDSEASSGVSKASKNRTHIGVLNGVNPRFHIIKSLRINRPDTPDQWRASSPSVQRNLPYVREAGMNPL